ncbi:pimeloyl-CoA dehydrogenase small subunit [Brevibacterium daeguense]|uniref:Pimeloyl-CoA dehydrogenase small subunit n=1 Tax=Brevibacterium daeguense TaxID=909936 RepID=A0ABP8EHJ2_9MICO|nr:acyl-CoA dehydrogenase family protein [Brevibacterium daeguense]
MDLELNDVQQELGATLARLLKTKYDAGTREEILASEQGYSQDMWNQYAELGLLGLPFAEDHGGAGMGFAEVAVVMEEFGKALILEPYLATVVLGGGLVNAVGTDEQKAQILPGVADGTTKLAFAGYEPTGRYDLTRPATTATVSGDSVTLTGEKSRVLGGDAADQLVVSAAIDGGVGLFLVDATAGGVNVDVRTQADGLKSASVLLDGATATRLGTGDATEAIARVIDTANAALMAEAVGAMEVSLQMTSEYLHTREQFGAPIGRNQVLQHRAADMYATLQDAKSMALYAKLAIVQDAAGTSTTRHRDVIAAKIIIDQAARHIMQESIQMHGGIGMTMEYPIGHYAKRLTVITKTFDEADALTAELAEAGGLIAPEAADLPTQEGAMV